MIAYFVIFALCGVIVVQAVIYYRERLKLYDILKMEKPLYNSEDKAKYNYRNKRHGTAHKIALEKWRSRGDSD